MVVNKRSGLMNKYRKIIKKKFNFGNKGKRIPELEKIIKEQRRKADAIGKQLLNKKTTSGGTIGRVKQQELKKEQRDYNVKAFQNEKILKRIKKDLLDIKKDKKGNKKLSLSDYNIDILWSNDKKEDIVSQNPVVTSTKNVNMKKIKLKPSSDKELKKQKNKLLTNLKKRKKLLIKLKKRNNKESLINCIKKNNFIEPFPFIRPKKNLHFVKIKDAVSGEIKYNTFNILKKAKSPLSEEKENSPKSEDLLYVGGPERWDDESHKLSPNKILNNRKEKLIVMKKIKSFLTRKEEKDLFIKKRKILLNRIKKLNISDLRKCVINKISVSNAEKTKDKKIDKEIEKIRKNISSSTGSVSSEPFQPQIYDWVAGFANDYTLKKRESVISIWDNILPNYEISKEARKLLNNPPKHFVYGRKDKVTSLIHKSWGDQGNMYTITHTNRIPLDLIKPTEIKEINFIHGKVKRKRNENLISKQDVIRAYKDNYYVNIINDFTRKNIKFASSRAQHFAYDNKIDVSLIIPISYFYNKVNFKKNPTELQEKKIGDKKKDLMQKWNTTGITLKDLKDNINNKPKYKLGKIEQLINTVQNIESGKQNINQQKIIEKEIKKTMAKIIRIKNEDDDNIIRIAVNLNIDPENNEEIVNKFNQLKNALDILREKMVYIPIISPKKTKLLEPWDI